MLPLRSSQELGMLPLQTGTEVKDEEMIEELGQQEDDLLAQLMELHREVSIRLARRNKKIVRLEKQIARMRGETLENMSAQEVAEFALEVCEVQRKVVERSRVVLEAE
jgi:hypothetical protein